jgi:tRNA-splicing ligase RtcB
MECRGALPVVGGKQVSDLARLREGTASFDCYLADLHWAQDFAARNREAMMEDVLRELERFLGRSVGRSEVIACCHNYTQQETHFGRQVWLTRKGAISANLGQMGLIPGSMGTASYVVEGLGNLDAFCSAPHGAGRRMSRGRAKRSFDLEQLATAMDGIEYRASDTLIDEHPGAYKDVAQVMEDAGDLVSIRHTLHQLLNVKGD